MLGQALVLVSDQPSTYAGYRFLIIDSPEANAFSAPGGFVLITKGLVKMTSNEAELAAVLAHEISHVALDHGVKAIQKDRMTGAWVGIGADAAKTLGPDEVKQMTEAFEGSVSDLTKAVVDKGYSRDTEFEADARACTILRRAGFSPRALLGMLQELRGVPQGSGPSMAKTHPSPQDRIDRVKKLVTGDPQATVSAVQESRYQAALGGI
jgi:predicted Zn-dependent protease